MSYPLPVHSPAHASTDVCQDRRRRCRHRCQVSERGRVAHRHRGRDARRDRRCTASCRQPSDADRLIGTVEARLLHGCRQGCRHECRRARWPRPRIPSVSSSADMSARSSASVSEWLPLTSSVQEYTRSEVAETVVGAAVRAAVGDHVGSDAGADTYTDLVPAAGALVGTRHGRRHASGQLAGADAGADVGKNAGMSPPHKWARLPGQEQHCRVYGGGTGVRSGAGTAADAAAGAAVSAPGGSAVGAGIYKLVGPRSTRSLGLPSSLPPMAQVPARVSGRSLRQT